MEYRYPENDQSMYVSYLRVREGPDSILVCYKNVSRFVRTAKELRAVFGPAKFTASVKAVSDWAEEQIVKYSKEDKPTLDQERIMAEGFGPEAHDDSTNNTRTII